VILGLGFARSLLRLELYHRVAALTLCCAYTGRPTQKNESFYSCKNLFISHAAIVITKILPEDAWLRKTEECAFVID